MAGVEGVFERFQDQLRTFARAEAHDVAAFRRRVAALALLGYLLPPLVAGALALGATLALQLVAGGGGTTRDPLLAAAITILSVAVLLAMTAVIRLFRGHATGPAADLLAPGDAPDLFALIEDLRHRTAAPPIDAVYLSDDLNAAVLQGRRFRPLLRRRRPQGRRERRQTNELVIGRPLLNALSESEFAAVVAHELAHLACDHGRIAMRFKRLYMAFSRMAVVTERRILCRLIGLPAFARWYARCFMAHAFPLYRRAELEADKIAARAAGGEAVGAALIRLAVDDAICGLAAVGGSGFGAAAILSGLLAEPTAAGDTHPCLRERLDALGAAAQLPPPLAQTAAQALMPA